MTQIAATVASIGKGHHAGKAHGAAAGAGAGFADFAASLGLPTGEGESADADAPTLTGEGAGTGAGTGEEARGEGEAGAVVVDLALGAAAQSAVADMVAAQVQPVTPPTNLSGMSAKVDDAIALDGRTGGRAAWRMLANAPATTESKAANDTTATAAIPVADNPAKDEVATDITAIMPKDAKPSRHEAAQARLAAQVKAETRTDAAATSKASVATENGTDKDVEVPVQTAQPAVQGEARPAQPRTVRTGVQTGAAFRQAARESMTAAPPSTEATATKAAPLAAAPIFSVLPQAEAASAKTAQPVGQQASDPAQEAATDGVVVETAITGAPIMSALQRPSPASTEAHGARHQAAADATVAPLARHGAETAQDQTNSQNGGKDSGTSASGAASDSQGASVTDMASAPGTQFSDILQNLPPIAQSRMGAVADSSAIVTGPADVGATLQGQVIDMGVEGQWIDRMAQEITTLAAGNGHSRFQLSPPNLGKIQIDVWQGENGGQVQVLTETDEAAQRLREGKHGLEADARLASLSLSSITIERASAGFDSGNDAAPQQQQPQGNQRHAQQGSDQGTGQGNNSLNAQTGQGDSRQGQSAAQANAQGNGQGQQNNGGQGKSSLNRDVLSERAGTVAQDGGSGRRDGDRLVRYA